MIKYTCAVNTAAHVFYLSQFDFVFPDIQCAERLPCARGALHRTQHQAHKKNLGVLFKKEAKMKKLRIILSAILCAVFLTVGISANEAIPVRINGIDTEMGALLIGSTTYVPFDKANTALSGGSAIVTGSPEDMRSVSPFASIRARSGNCYIEAEGRYFGGSDSIVVSGMLYVPIRSIAKAYGSDVTWQSNTRSVDLTPAHRITHGEQFYDPDAVYWLSRIISAEAIGEPMDGKILVGNVILNRVASNNFPNSIYGVIFDRNYGVQFTPTANGTIYNTPSEDSIIAAKLCLDSYYLSRSALYFLNPAIATNFWVPANRPYLMTVGNHAFYS